MPHQRQLTPLRYSYYLRPLHQERFGYCRRLSLRDVERGRDRTAFDNCSQVRVDPTIWPRFPQNGALGVEGGNGASLKLGPLGGHRKSTLTTLMMLDLFVILAAASPSLHFRSSKVTLSGAIALRGFPRVLRISR